MRLTAVLANSFNQQPEVFVGAPSGANRFTVTATAVDAAGLMVSAVLLRFDNAATIFTAEAVQHLALQTPGWTEVSLHRSDTACRSFKPAVSVPLSSPIAITLDGAPDGLVGATGWIRLELTMEEGGNALHATAKVNLAQWQQPRWLPNQVGFGFRSGADRLLLTQDPHYPLPKQVLELLVENKDPDKPLPMPTDAGRDPRLELSFDYGPGAHCIGTAEAAAAILIGPGMDAPSGKCNWQCGNHGKPKVGSVDHPIWVLKPAPSAEMLLGMGGDATVTFNITVPEAWPGQQADETQLHIKWFDIPGYDDGNTALRLTKDLPAPSVTLTGPSPSIANEGDPCPLSWSSVAVSKLVLSTTGMPEITFDKPEDMNRLCYLAPLPPAQLPAPQMEATFTLTAYDLEKRRLSAIPPVTVDIKRPRARIVRFDTVPGWRLPAPRESSVQVFWAVSNALSISINGQSVEGANGSLRVTLKDKSEVELLLVGHDGVQIKSALTVLEPLAYLESSSFACSFNDLRPETSVLQLQPDSEGRRWLVNTGQYKIVDYLIFQDLTLHIADDVRCELTTKVLTPNPTGWDSHLANIELLLVGEGLRLVATSERFVSRTSPCDDIFPPTGSIFVRR